MQWLQLVVVAAFGSSVVSGIGNGSSNSSRGKMAAVAVVAAVAAAADMASGSCSIQW